MGSLIFPFGFFSRLYIFTKHSFFAGFAPYIVSWQRPSE
jgi:hypothetical protein